MILKNDFKIEKHLVTYKTQSFKYIISPGYIASESITIITFVLLKNASN